MRILLLGAGASKSYEGSPTGLRMPIAKDFFQTFEKLDISNNPWVLRDGLISYLHREKGIQDPQAYLRSGIDIEALHSEIALRLQEVATDVSGPDRIVLSKPYNELIFLFSATLNTIANGPTSKSHIDLAAWLNLEDVIITFNWDTLMERALMETCSWCVDDGYGIKPFSIYRDGWEEPVKNDQRSYSIIKLHGSTNWITGYPFYEYEQLVLTHGLSNDSVFVFERASKPFATHDGRYMDGYGPLTYGYYPPNLTSIPGRPAIKGHVFIKAQLRVPGRPKGTSGDTGVPSIPLIIPPVQNKSYDFFGSLFTGLWAKAEEVIAESEEIVVIGYSFPHTDLQSLDLFRNAFSKKSTMPHISIIDPEPSRPADVFERELGIKESHMTVIAEPFRGAESLAKL